MTIYLSGPMTGLPEKNYPTFNKWARLFRDRGHQVINPADNFGGDQTRPWSEYMELDFNNVLVAEAVVLLPGWEFSQGARLEIAVAQAIGRPIYLVEDFTKNKLEKQKLKVQVFIEKVK